MPDAVLPPVRATFRALVTTFVPEAAALDEHAWTDAEAIAERFLATRTAAIRRQLRLLIRLLGLLALARHGRPFTALDPARRHRFLAALQNAPLLLVRRGIWGLRTIAFMAYYARPDAATAIGYRADPRGREARR